MFSWRKLFGLSAPASRMAVKPAPPSHLSDMDESADDWDGDPVSEYERYRLARHAVVLRPKAPFVRWIHKSLRNGPKYARNVPEHVKKLSNTPGMPTQAQLCKTSTAYLIGLHDDEDLTVREHVERDFVFFFKRELEQWEPQGDGNWPSSITLALFRQWFELESFDLVLDTARV